MTGDKLSLVYTQIVPVIFEPPCILKCSTVLEFLHPVPFCNCYCAVFCREKSSCRPAERQNVRHDRWMGSTMSVTREAIYVKYRVVQIWPGQTVTCLHTNSPGHVWTTLYNTAARSRNNCCRGKSKHICSLSYPAYNAHAPYCLRPPWLHHIFPHYLINGKIFGKKLLYIKCVFWFSLQFYLRHFPF
jgi:hypothetical protein